MSLSDVTDEATDFRSWHGRNFIDHRIRRKEKSVRPGRLDCEPDVDRFDQGRRQRANADGQRRVETVALHDNGRSRLGGVIGTTGERPDFSALHLDELSSRHQGIDGSRFSKAAASGEFHQDIASTQA